MKNTILIAAILSIVFIAGCVSQPSAQTVKIGFIAPLTGDAAVYGLPLKNMVELATEEINSQGGIDGKKVEIIYEDGKCNGKDAATAMQKLVSVDKVRVIFGGFCSSESLGAEPIATQNK
ncbi:MAG: ABC transporter substrate-binding protein, partial [Candidatus Aenigmarchaeota archaeon]|nr:ABC transporter substrate-binding protein [Candidatus Aenigmarchaeota archaeon]MDI6722303.1 ABC transporter substrate-binding protein [Candidatus Aenigmarchaeota archaeon]